MFRFVIRFLQVAAFCCAGLQLMVFSQVWQLLQRAFVKPKERTNNPLCHPLAFDYSSDWDYIVSYNCIPSLDWAARSSHFEFCYLLEEETRSRPRAAPEMPPMGNASCTASGSYGCLGFGSSYACNMHNNGTNTSHRAPSTVSNSVTASKSYSSAGGATARCSAPVYGPQADLAPAGPMNSHKRQHSGPSTPAESSDSDEEDPDIKAIGGQLGALITSRCDELITEATKALLPGALEAAAKRRAAQLERDHEAALLQAKSEYDAHINDLTSSFEKDLQAKDAHIAHLTAEVAAKEQALDDLEFKLEGMKQKGKELFTYQGLTTSEASLHQLKTVIKDLTAAAYDVATQLLNEHAAVPRVPCAIALDSCTDSQRKQVNMHGLLHAVLCEVSRLVFINLRSADFDLTVNARSCRDVPCSHQDSLALQLQLEKKKALDWLQMLGGDPSGSTNAQHDAAASGSVKSSSSSSSCGSLVSTFLQAGFAQLTSQVVHSLLGMIPGCGLVLWPGAEQQSGLCTMCSTPQPVAAALQPAVCKLVASAVRAQVIASAMHSQLIRLVVPGWSQPDVSGLRAAAVAAASEAVPQLAAKLAEWETGVVPVGPWSKQDITVGVPVPASTDIVVKGVDAAVFCQEPAVVQLAERVGDLPEFGGQQLVKPFKVLHKARMCVAWVDLAEQ